MIEVTKYRGLKIGVFGLGITGISTIHALSSGGAHVIAWDDDASKRDKWLNDVNPNSLAISMKNVLVNINNNQWQTISALVLSPGVPVFNPHPVVQMALKYNIPIISDIELLYHSARPAKFIGVTGTNGKSTTTSLISHILKQNKLRVEMGGNIGIPALNLQPLGSDGSYVIELSSYHLILLDQIKLDTAILLNITEDHIEHHGSFENYIEAKKKIFFHQDKNAVAIIGVDTEPTAEIYYHLKENDSHQHLIPISTDRILDYGISILDNVIYCNLDKNQKFELGDMSHLPGNHNAQNIAAAFACCYFYHIQPAQIIKAISNFKGLKHRLEWIATINQVRFINDSKATNAESVEKAIDCFDNIYLILGGIAKSGGIENS